MSLSNKELLDKIKDEVWNHAYPFGNGEWKSGRNDDLWPIVCERFATEKAKELLPKEKKENKICIASHGPVSAQAESEYKQFEGKNLHIVTPESSEPQEKRRTIEDVKNSVARNAGLRDWSEVYTKILPTQIDVLVNSAINWSIELYKSQNQSKEMRDSAQAFIKAVDLILRSYEELSYYDTYDDTDLIDDLRYFINKNDNGKS